MSEHSEDERFKRDHRWAPGQMSAYLDRELASNLRARLEHHVDECAECRRLLATLSRMLDLLGGLSAPGDGRDPAAVAASVRVRLQGPG